MNKPKIKYVGFYDLKNSIADRASNLSAIKKMDYVSDAITRAGFSVNIVSPSWFGLESRINLSSQKSIYIKDDLKVTFTPSWKSKTKIDRKVKVMFSLIWLFLYLLATTSKNEKIIVYHAQWLSIPIRWAKKIRKFHVVLEVEEIYAEVWKNPSLLNNWEKKLINSADSYIFVSDKLKKRLDHRGKKSLLLYGAYVPKSKLKSPSIKDNYIHLVYAGSIDQVKGGAFKSLELIKELPNNYKLHLLGGGNKVTLKALIEKIDGINKEKSYEAVLYKGTLHGKEFTDYLLRCDIALNPQNQGEYMNTAFPSKIITYLAHNLNVVSTPIESIKSSRIAQYINFSKGDSSRDFIEVIINHNGNTTENSSDVIKRLDQDFVRNLRSFLKD